MDRKRGRRREIEGKVGSGRGSIEKRVNSREGGIGRDRREKRNDNRREKICCKRRRRNKVDRDRRKDGVGNMRGDRDVGKKRNGAAALERRGD